MKIVLDMNDEHIYLENPDRWLRYKLDLLWKESSKYEVEKNKPEPLDKDSFMQWVKIISEEQ